METKSAHPGSKYMETLGDEEQKQSCLKHYAEVDKPAAFGQLDGFAGYEDSDDYIMVPDNDGDVVYGGSTHELMRSGTTVRLLIAKDADPWDVLRLIDKLKDFFIQSPAHCTNGFVKWNDGEKVISERPFDSDHQIQCHNCGAPTPGHRKIIREYEYRAGQKAEIFTRAEEIAICKNCGKEHVLFCYPF